MKIGILGSGYVGLVTGACLAQTDNIVTCYDVQTEKITQLQEGVCPIHEPHLGEMIRTNQREGRLFFSSDLGETIAQSDILMTTVGTPSKVNGEPDLSAIYELTHQLGEKMDSPKLILQKSTVPPGTADEVEDLINRELKERGKDIKVETASNPEFLKEGDAVNDFMRPDRIILGVDSRETEHLLCQLYAPFMKSGYKIITMNKRSAELTKYACNAALAQRITLMNALSRIAENVGADIEEVRRGMGSDPRIGDKFLYPGVGFGGSCFPKDVEALTKVADRTDQECGDFFHRIESMNKTQKDHFANKILRRFRNDLNGITIAIWGLAFKANTDDVRESPALYIVKELLCHQAKVKVYDPAAMNNFQHQCVGSPRLIYEEGQYQATQEADALAILTEWLQFRSPDLEKLKETMNAPIIFDGRNVLDPMTVQQGGFEYYGVGRNPVP